MTTGEQQIDYDAIAQDAMRGIVRSALRRVAELGYLPGQHHFYIAFDTRAPGVVVSKRLKQRYPEEMTIVLQHQFRDLAVSDEQFEVTLSFDNLPERLVVPLRAVRVFFDPSVRYGIQFDSSDLVKEPAEETAPREAEGGDRQAGTARLPKPRATRKPRTPRDAADDTSPAPATASQDARKVTPDAETAVQRRQPGRPTRLGPDPEQPITPANDAKVVQLDKFRKR